ncbi:MAG: B12-binding domain-containing protein [Phycisphaerae bacterium]|nr:B12-binding domain-containing protein [Phycisphaerae bacterium]
MNRTALSPKEMAEAIGVSESSLKRWADGGLIRVARTAGGHRRISLPEAVRFVREQGIPVVRPELLGLPEVSSLQLELQRAGSETDRLYDFLTTGRSKEARGVVTSAYLRGTSAAQLADDIIAPAMARVGDLWRHDPAGIFVEHRATDIMIQAVNQLRLLIEPPANAPEAVGGAPAGDPYVLPSLLVATVLTAEGYHAVNLGANCPTESLLQAAQQHKARLAWISVSGVTLEPFLARDMVDFSGKLAAMGTRLIVGGRTRPVLPAGSDRHIQTGVTMAELAAFARGLLAADDARQQAS